MKYTLPLLLISAALLLWSAGCEIVTEPQPAPPVSPAGKLVINEVFTLPLSPTSYSWVEFLNASPDTVNVRGWTLTYTTIRADIQIVTIVDTPRHTVNTLPPTIVADSSGVLEVPLSAQEDLRLFPGDLLTIVDNEDRLLDHSEWGSGKESTHLERSFFLGPVFQKDTLSFGDTIFVITSHQKGYRFALNTTEQLVLKNSSGQIIDVVRYGNYMYSGSSTDPLMSSSNRSYGSVPTYESIFRYAGAYFTGDTYNDFGNSDISRGRRPTPHEYNPQYWVPK